MPFAKKLRQLFHGVDQKIENLFLLEPYQIDSLQSRVPEQEFAAVLFAYPHIKSFFINKHPPFTEYIRKVQDKYGPAKNKKELAEFSDRLLWETSFNYVVEPINASLYSVQQTIMFKVQSL